MTPTRILLIGTATVALLAGCNQAAVESQPAAGAASAADTAQPAVATTASNAQASTTGFTSETKTFRQWTAVCDNVNNCTAYGPAEDDTGYLLVKMAAGPSAKPEVQMGNCCLGEAGDTLRFYIDNGAYRGVQKYRHDEGSQIAIANASDQLMSAIANGRVLTMEAGDETVHKIEVALAGAAAAFLWIDERQGRLGSTTALIRKGDRAASTVPAAPPRPRIQAAAAIAQSNLPSRMPAAVANLPTVRECAESDNTSERWDVHRLGPDTLLWDMPCGAGAYNFSRIYVTSANDGANARLVTFPTTGQSTTRLINSSFDPKSRTLSAFGKGRGIGDCGEAGEWVWTGRSFTLLSETVMGDCLGVHWTQWPATYSATL